MFVAQKKEPCNETLRMLCKILNCIKSTLVHNLLSSFTHPQVIPNLYEFLSSVEHEIIYFEKCW